jgi:hypothetical protein
MLISGRSRTKRVSLTNGLAYFTVKNLITFLPEVLVLAGELVPVLKRNQFLKLKQNKKNTLTLNFGATTFSTNATLHNDILRNDTHHNGEMEQHVFLHFH